MGGSSTQRQTNNLLDQQRRSSGQDYDSYLGDSKKRLGGIRAQEDEGYSGMKSAFQGYMDTGGFNPGDFDRVRGSGGFSGGSSVADELSSTGGIDESAFGSALKGYGDFASSGGGIDSAGIRARSNSAIPGFYANLKNEASRRRMVNPYAPTFDAEGRAMARQAGQHTQENVRNTELDISDMITRNKQFGIAGLGNLNMGIQGMKQSGKIAGGSQQIANAGLRGSDMDRNSRNEMQILDMVRSGKLAGLGGMEGLYNTKVGQGESESERWLAGIGGKHGNQMGAIANRQNIDPWWKQLLGAGVGIAGAYAGAPRGH